jgi:hypothetical protein
VNLDIDNLLLSCPITVSYHKNKPQKIKENLLYILSVLTNQTIKHGGDGDITKYEGWVPICSKILERYISNYKQYLRWLVNTGIIERNGSWQSRNACQGHRYTEPYRKKLNRRKSFYIYNKKLCEKLKEFRTPVDVTNKYQYLVDWFDGLDFDDDDADRILHELYPKDYLKREYHYNRLLSIRHKNQQSFSIGTTGRLYTPLTNLKKELRDCLRYDDLELTDYDLPCSIPFISTYLFDYKFLYKHKNILFNAGLTLRESTDPPHIMFRKKSNPDVVINTQAEDVLRYIQDVRQDDIYTLLADKWNTEIEASYKRNTAKRKFLSIINSPTYIDYHEKEILASMYPTVIKYFDAINGTFKLSKHRAEGSAEVAPFSYITQSIESRFVLSNVCGKLSIDHPQIPLFTIHDSILTTQLDQTIVPTNFKRLKKDYFHFILT